MAEDRGAGIQRQGDARYTVGDACAEPWQTQLQLAGRTQKLRQGWQPSLPNLSPQDVRDIREGEEDAATRHGTVGE